MELRYTPIKSILMEAGESCRVPIPLQRCPLSKLISAPNRKQSQRVGSASRKIDVSEIEATICSQHISSLVDLRWCLPGTGTSGKASLSGFQCSREMLQIIKASPLIWEVSVNSELVRPQEEITCNVGDVLSLGVRIKVCSGLGQDPSSPGYQSYNNKPLQTISVPNGPKQVSSISDTSKQSDSPTSKELSDGKSEIPSDSRNKIQESTLSPPSETSVPKISTHVIPPIVEPSETNSVDALPPRFTLPRLALSLRFFQDHRNGVSNYRLDTRLATAGAVNRVPLPQLSEGGEAYHESSVVFFTPGQYKVDISCSSIEEGSSGFLGKTISGSESSSSTTWRFVPPIEITVEDV
ncbi:hypothetical protein J437_LFUL010623 [Ladona fulva]|uniref:Trs120/TRAPPC9 fourth Ig-like domain-containing protein n=1 Tax=Ladona fulva TaxID=123851 RepID=A0A8K0K818_LADFU|nr:hypothetical protein J437_LFUL010623 [Ladona fulva]